MSYYKGKLEDILDLLMRRFSQVFSLREENGVLLVFAKLFPSFEVSIEEPEEDIISKFEEFFSRIIRKEQ